MSHGSADPRSLLVQPESRSFDERRRLARKVFQKANGGGLGGGGEGRGGLRGGGEGSSGLGSGGLGGGEGGEGEGSGKEGGGDGGCGEGRSRRWWR